MGTRKRAGKVSKQSHTHVRATGKTEQHTVKREQLDIIASICGTTRNQVGKVSFEASGVNDSKHDVRNECAERERSSSDSTATAVSDERDSPGNHRL